MARISSSFSIILLVLFGLSPPALSQECSLPDASTISTELLGLLTSVGGEGPPPTVNLLEHHFTCLAVASRDRYRILSVATRYNKSTENGEFVAQFRMECGGGNTYSSSELDQSPPANVFSIETRRDCRTCTSTNVPNTDTTADCILCSSSCQALGQGACLSATSCCPFFTTEGSCTLSCPVGSIATASSNFTCEVCSLPCPLGYSPNSTCDGCNPVHICLTNNPCQNGADCVIGSNNTDYSCSCVANFTGNDCEVCLLDCPVGYEINSNCSGCDAVHICFTNDPCQNGATCNISNTSPGFKCLCPPGFTGVNCSTDIVDCAAGFVPQLGRCVEDCNTTCSGKGAFDFDICQYSCLLRNWKRQAEDCNVSFSNLNITIDTNLPIEEQWMAAVTMWTELHDAWASEASRRGVNIASSTELASGQTDISLWTSSLEQWRSDQQSWLQTATQLSPDFPVQDLSTLNFNFPDTSPAQLSTSYVEVVNYWTTANTNYQNELADQCPA